MIPLQARMHVAGTSATENPIVGPLIPTSESKPIWPGETEDHSHATSVAVLNRRCWWRGEQTDGGGAVAVPVADQQGQPALAGPKPKTTSATPPAWLFLR